MALAPRVAIVTLHALEPEGLKGVTSFRSYRGQSSLDMCAPVVAHRLASPFLPIFNSSFFVMTNSADVVEEARRYGFESQRIPEELQAAVDLRRLRGNAQDPPSFWKLASLFKVAAVKYTEFSHVCFHDIDVVLNVHPLLWMLRDRKSAPARLLGCGMPQTVEAPHAELINGGLLCIRPQSQDYLELLDLVANASFDYERGWRPLGAPTRDERRAVQPDGSPINWRFPGSGDDQGLLLYHYHVRHGSFATPHRCTPQAAAFDRRLFYHFLGGVKPWHRVALHSLQEYYDRHRPGFCSWFLTLAAISKETADGAAPASTRCAAQMRRIKPVVWEHIHQLCPVPSAARGGNKHRSAPRRHQARDVRAPSE
ncbi:hypothetical protein AB1Y20_015979 [Prymnesium parvum]|uniref:Hexosyltransferase n=1 Tax=Prymnesium parvum TaxID=97485 RepID=A0AB34K241_PRYPA|mmetsp:Transcript_8698/g.21473  ORF Transcript_8698/g.21473 Transcript_8698/m.21473 type:complete len:368 (-) Transcript_8698:225-1328(-)